MKQAILPQILSEDIYKGYRLVPFVCGSSTSLTRNLNIPFDGTEFLSLNFDATSIPPTGTLYSYRLEGVESLPFTSWDGYGRYSGIRPSCLNAVPWSQLMCS